MHYKQRKIIKKLICNNGQRYSELYKEFEYEDRFPYHLKKLINDEFIQKKQGLYYLTKKGVHFSAYFHSRTLEEVKHKITRAALICKNWDNKFLLLKLINSEGKSHYTLPGCNLKYGSKIKEFIITELWRKYRIRGIPQYRATCHHRLYTDDYKYILFDDIELIYDVKITSLDPDYQKPKKLWLNRTEISRLPQKNVYSLINKYIIENCHERFIEIDSSENLGLMS